METLSYDSLNTDIVRGATVIALLSGVVFISRNFRPFYKLIVIGLLYLVIHFSSVYSEEEDTLFIRACTRHSTTAVCVNLKKCDKAKQTFAIDEEWAAYRRNVCIEGMPTSKARLYNSYGPESCAAWGDCSQVCIDTLQDIRATIDAYACEPDHKVDPGGSLLDSVLNFPMANLSIVPVMPFTANPLLRVWAGLAVVVSVAMLVAHRRA